jgi:hypothetical protein
LEMISESVSWREFPRPPKSMITIFEGFQLASHSADSLEPTVPYPTAELQSCKVVTVQVGSEQKVYSTEETIAGRAAVAFSHCALFVAK